MLESAAQAATALESTGDARVALVLLLTGCDADTARDALARSAGRTRAAVALVSTP